MKTKPTHAALLALCLGLCSCAAASHSAYYNTISRNLDKARADGKISERDYFRSKMQLEAMENHRIARRDAQVGAALASVTANTNAQIQANQARQQAMTDAMTLQAIRNQHPRTYDSTVTPTYLGGPVHVHTEESGGN